MWADARAVRTLHFFAIKHYILTSPFSASQPDFAVSHAIFTSSHTFQLRMNIFVFNFAST